MERIMDAEETDDSMRSCVASYHGILQWCDGWRLYRKYIEPAWSRMEATT